MKGTALVLVLACALAACRLEQPSPSVSSVLPAAVCGAGAVTLTISGESFGAIVERALDGTPRITVPSVALSAPGLEIAIASDSDGGASIVHWDSSRVLRADVGEGVLIEAQYAVRVTNPDGRSGTLAAAFTRTAAAGPQVTTVTPPVVCGFGGMMTLDGVNLQNGATARLVDPVSGMTLQGSVTFESATRAQLSFGENDFGRNQLLDLVITNPDGCAAFARLSVRSKPGMGGCP